MSVNQLTVIRLKSHHKSQIVSLIKERQHFKPLSWILSDHLDIYLNSNDFPVMFGAFQNQKLLSTMGLWRWHGLPYATLTFQLIKPGFVFFNNLTNGYTLLLEKSMEYGSQNDIFVYYVFRKKRSLKAMLKTLNLSNKKYFSYTEAVIPKNTRPKESAYWDMMDHEIKPFTGEIKRIKLKPEFLSSLDWPGSKK